MHGDVQLFGTQQSLTPISHTYTKGYWHSSNEMNPWLALRMSSFVNGVAIVEVEDRKAGCCFDRFKNVEVSVGSSASMSTNVGKISCGIKSYQGSSTTYV